MEEVHTQSDHDHFYGAVTILCSIGKSFVSEWQNIFWEIAHCIKKSNFY